MKTLRHLILLTLFCFCGTVMAEEASYEKINYTLDLDRSTAEVALNPQVYGELTIPEVIRTEKGDFRVTSIGDKAFQGAKLLYKIQLPKTIEHIYRSAFEGTGIMLDRENWADGVLILDSTYLIASDKTIKPKYEVPDYVRLVAIGAFRGNKTLTKVSWSPRVKQIDHEMFRDCKNLIKLEIPESVEWIGEDILTGSGIYQNEK